MVLDNEFDVIVVGSGGGGLLSALRAHDLGMKVLVIEKSDQYGGTTATSGGVAWIPLNDQIHDDYDAAYAYLKAAVGETTSDGKVRAYLESAGEMVRYLNDRTSTRYQACLMYPDYYQEMPGAAPGGRSMEPLPFDAARLGNELSHLRDPHPCLTLMGKSMTVSESVTLATKGSGWLWVTLKTLGRYYLDFPWRLKTRRDRRLCLGNALIASLRHSMLMRDIPLWLNCPMVSLVQEDGQVTGVVASREGKRITINAHKGVVLAAGGFDRNQVMRDQYLPQPSRKEWSSTPPDLNTGDTIKAAAMIGARLENMDQVWGTPSVPNPHVPQGQQPIFCERGLGGFIAVNKQGKRFVDEAISYDRFQAAMCENHRDTGGCIPAWFIFDARFRMDSPMGPFLPAIVFPDSKVPKAWYGDIFFKSETLEDLAAQIGIDPLGLADSIRRNNEYARSGVDLDFGRGNNLHDRYWSNKSVKPNPCLIPIEKGPFYAIKVMPSDTGTKGGPSITDDAQVISATGEPIPGLYCIGNNSSAVLGRAYAGAGGTIGPGMVFGYRAANHLGRSR